MPSREEIVEWLREAADIAYDYSPQGVGHYVLLNEHAAQVESMHCKTCSNFGGEGVRTNHEGRTKFVRCLKFKGCEFPDDFGCFHHEQKPDG